MKLSSLSARCQADVQTKLAKDFASVLAKQRGRTVEGERRIGEIQRTDDLRHLARGRMRQLAKHAAMPDLRLGENLRHRVNRRARHAGGVQQGGQLGATPLSEL